MEKASYISRSVLESEYDGQTYRPKYHEDLVHNEITLPENAPKEYAEVIGYNQKNLERELQNESRQQGKMKRRDKEI